MTFPVYSREMCVPRGNYLHIAESVRGGHRLYQNRVEEYTSLYLLLSHQFIEVKCVMQTVSVCVVYGESRAGFVGHHYSALLRKTLLFSTTSRLQRCASVIYLYGEHLSL
jgi:hypothetical protein